MHLDEVEKLEVPEAAEDVHRNYVGALDGLIATRDEVIAKAQSTSGAELLADFWEPDPQVGVVDATCLAMPEVAASEGFTITLPLCTED